MALRLCTLLFLLSATLSAQTSPRDLLRAAFDRQRATAEKKTRLTDIRLVHTLNTEPDGSVTYNAIEKFEETWINDLPYLRLIEVDGKPLSGRALRDEQQRYDRAVTGHQPLGNEERIRIDQSQPVTIDAQPEDALTEGFTLRELRGDLLPQGRVRVIEATGVPTRNTVCRWRYQFWITENDPMLVRSRIDVADTPTPPAACRGAYNDVSYQLFDGFPVKAHERSHFYIYERGARIIVDGDTAYSNYRRFSATVTISPGPNPAKAGSTTEH